MRFASPSLPAFGSFGFAAAFVALAALAGCSDDSGTVKTGALKLDGVTSKHAASTLKFTATFKNDSAKAVKTIDSFEIDPGSGAKKATAIRNCEGSDAAPWLVKSGASATVEFTVRNNGTERMAVEAYCLEGGKPSERTALWEFLSQIETNGSEPIKIAVNGTYEDGAVWSLTATSTRQ